MNKKNLTGLGLQSKALTAFSQFIWASENIRGRLFSLLSENGITASQYGVLDALYHLGPKSQKQLGSHILKSGGNITMVVDNLEKNGLVKRERRKDDRRLINVSITGTGRKEFNRILPLAVKFIEDAMSSLSSREQEELGCLCVKIVSGK
jgi:MarR family 2-MHQ and catechol resistance regulon transcriptional repressor